MNKKFNHSSIPKAVGSRLHRVGRDPYMDWPIIVSVFTAVAVVLISAGVFEYISISEQVVEPTISAKTVAPDVASKDLQTVMSAFVDKQARLDVVSRGYDGPTDPGN